MNLAISNFAWDNSQHDFIFDILKKNNITNIETVLTKINDWDFLKNEDIINYKKEIDSYGMNPCSIQSLFYNVKCDDLSNKEQVITHFKKLLSYSKILDIKIMVLGSPKLRNKSKDWKINLIETLKIIDEMLDGTDIQLVIEPNSSIYGGKYFHTIGEIIFFLDMYEFRNIKTMIDTHNSLLENSDPIVELNHFFNYIEHIHISEINLTKLIDLDFHDKFSQAIKKSGYEKTITFELGKCDNVSDAINNFSNIYK